MKSRCFVQPVLSGPALRRSARAAEFASTFALCSVFQQGHRALAAVGANAHNGAAPGRHGGEFFHRLAKDARTGSGERVPKRDAAAVGVHALARKFSERMLDPGLFPDKSGVLQTLEVARNLR